jgi:hypothetical protein
LCRKNLPDDKNVFILDVMFLQVSVLSLIVHFVLMWLQDGDAKPQLIAPTYATVRRTGSITSSKRAEGDAGYVTIRGYLHEIQNLYAQLSS